MKRGDEYAGKGKLREAAIEYHNAIKQDPTAIEPHQKLADVALQNHDSATAAQELLHLADLQPTDPAAQVRAGALYLLAGRFDDARARGEAALQLNPDFADAHVIVGEALAAMHDLDAGQERLREAVRLAPASVEARVALASAEWSAGKVADAEADCKAALQVDGNSVAANRAMALLLMATNRAAQSEANWKVIASSPSGDPFALADFLISQGRAPDAITQLEAVRANASLRNAADDRLAAVRLLQGNVDAARQTVDGVLSRKADDVPALLLKARLQASAGDLRGALASTQAAEHADPASADAAYLHGEVSFALGDSSAAVQAFDQARTLAPQAAAPRVALSRLALATAGANNALAWAEGAVKAEPRNRSARAALVSALVANHLLSRADAEAAADAQTWPDAADVQARLGQVKLAENDLPAARRAFSLALARDPTSPEALGGLARLDIDAHQPSEATARIEQALKTAHLSPTLLRLAGETYLRAGDFQKAEAVLKQAQSTGPMDVGAAELLAEVYARERRNDAAEAQYAAVIAARPEAAVAANNLAWMYVRDGRLDEALKLALSAKERLDRSPEVNDTLGWIYVQMNRAKDAVPLFVISTLARPGNPTYAYHLAVAYARTGDTVGARRAVTAALQAAQFSERNDAAALAASLGH